MNARTRRKRQARHDRELRRRGLLPVPAKLAALRSHKPAAGQLELPLVADDPRDSEPRVRAALRRMDELGL